MGDPGLQKGPNGGAGMMYYEAGSSHPVPDRGDARAIGKAP